MVSIDGSYGEGGGQILRTCCTLSAVTGLPVQISNIRAGREKPGLRAQHLIAVNAAAQICGARLSGAEQGSTELLFEPKKPVEAGEYRFEISTAGSSTLVMQTVFPALALAGDSKVTVTGGTHNPMAPTADYVERVYAGMARRLGWPLDVEYGPAGFFPRGGGEIRATIGKAQPKAFDLISDRNPWDEKPRGRVVLANLPARVGERAAGAFSYHFGAHCQVVEVESPGVGFVAHVFYGEEPVLGFTEFGEKGIPAEQVIADLFDQATEAYEKGFGGVDEHLADQLVPLAALTPGESVWQANTVSEHLRTVLWLAGEFGCPVAEWDEGSGLVRVVGIGR